MAKDYYQILGVKKSDSDEIIKKSYKKLALKYHPDRAEDSKKKEYEDNFKSINEAYSVLSDPKKKQRYDAGETGNFSSRSHAGNNFEDIFADLFRGGFGNSSYESEPDLDLNYEFVIEFNEAVFGCEKEIMINQDLSCKKCDGSGSKDGEVAQCGECDGHGVLEVTRQTPWGGVRQRVKCASCKGKGEIIKAKCDVCNGDGIKSSRNKVKIKIPAGIDNGQTLRVIDEGNSAKGREKGDLFLTIRVNPHKSFQRKGFDIYTEFKISFSQAALGDKIMVPTISEEVKIKVPSGTESGSVLRIKGKGVQHINRPNSKGDQFVKLIVKIPKNLSRDQKKLLKELKKLD